MKTLIINGSPRKEGDSFTLVNEVLKYLNGEKIIINTYYDNINPCIDCRYCFNNYNCSIKDGMQDIYKLMDEVDNIIISSPVYFSELTGSFLNFASRLQMFYASGKKIKRKKGIIILSAGGSTKNFNHILNTAKIILSEINTELVGTIITTNTDKVKAKEDFEALRKAREMATILNT